MEKYHKLLSNHFSEAQLEMLIPIIRLMQDPYSFEIGILQLKAQKLYRQFGAFVREYIYNYNCPSIYQNTVKSCIQFMFSQSIVLDMPSRKCYYYHVCETQKMSLNESVLPLFAPCLDILVMSSNPFRFVNAHDIDYSIKLSCEASHLEGLPNNVYDLYYNVWHDVSGENIPLHNLTYPSLKQLTIDFTPPTYQYLTGCLDISRLTNLTKLSIMDFTPSNYTQMRLPTSLKGIVVTFTNEDDEKALTLFLDHLFASCPNIEKISCKISNYLYSYFDTHFPSFKYVLSQGAFIKQHE